MKAKIDWIIHFVANGVRCDVCGETESCFPRFICNAHPHGMEKYKHLDFQMVLQLPPEEVGRILNTLGLRVQSGEHFKNGDLVSGIYEDCDIRLSEFKETGRKFLRIVIPDKHNRFPENPDCEYPYNMQIFTTESLEIRRSKQ